MTTHIKKDHPTAPVSDVGPASVSVLMPRAKRSSVATIHDVARQAGVSIKTVSRVVNREPNVRPETTHRVQQVIRELNYRPNFSARNLAGRKAYLLALVYDNPSDNYLVGIQHGALQACRQQGYNVVLQPCVHDRPGLVEELLTLVRERRPAGLILTPPLSDLPDLLQVLDENDVAYVCVGAAADVQGKYPVVRADDQQGAYEMTSYLLNLGHQRIGYIKSLPAHASASARILGYVRAHEEQGVTVDSRLIVQGAQTFESGRECARVLLAQRDRPTAIFAANDDMAAGVMHAAYELGLKIPHDLSVAGFDDSPVSRSVWPSMTTLRQPIKLMAETAVNVLISYIGDRNRNIDSPRRVEVMRNELIIRESTAAPYHGVTGRE